MSWIQAQRQGDYQAPVNSPMASSPTSNNNWPRRGPARQCACGGGGHCRPYRAGRLALDRACRSTRCSKVSATSCCRWKSPRPARGGSGRGRESGLNRRAPRSRRPAGPQSANRLFHVPGPDRRWQNRADQGARRISFSMTKTRCCASTCRNIWRNIRSPG